VNTVTVVLEHPIYPELSSVILQEHFEFRYSALRCYHDLSSIYTEGHYSVVILESSKQFNISEHNDILRRMREQ
jgi:hypothetical protein